MVWKFERIFFYKIWELCTKFEGFSLCVEKFLKNWSKGCLETKATKGASLENMDLVSIMAMTIKIWQYLLILLIYCVSKFKVQWTENLEIIKVLLTDVIKWYSC